MTDWSMPKRSSKRTKTDDSDDLNVLAHGILSRATGDPAAKTPTEPAPAMPRRFPYTIGVAWSEAEGRYVGRVAALDVEARGDTPADAAKAAHEAGEAQLASLAAVGKGAPADEPESVAAALGRKGGLKGGAARAASLSKKRRAEIAKRAAKARWAR